MQSVLRILSSPAARYLTVPVLILAVYMAVNLSGKRRAVLRNYTLHSGRIGKPFRIVLVTDLHNCRYGSGMQVLLDLISAQKPDCILLGGDLYHNRGNSAADQLLSRLPSIAPCCMVLGNHEKRRKDISSLRGRIGTFGIRLLGGENETLFPGITVTGIVDFGHKMPLHTLSQLRSAYRRLPPNGYRILLVHRPDLIPLFLRFDFDLILCGHTHGGQCRLPAHPSGLFAPGQGIFPKYAGGEYRVPHAQMIISRGLSNKPWWAARIGNPPELCVIDLLPDPQERESR